MTQGIVVAIVVAICAGYVAWKAVRTLRAKKGDCGCGTCPNKPDTSARTKP